MTHKNHYKKIFIAAAALFILFAPVGVRMGSGVQTYFGNASSPTAQGIAINSALLPSPFSSFRLTFNLNLAEATTASPVISGAGAGSQTTPQTPGFFSCASNAVTCSVYYVALTVNGIMGVLVSVGAFLVRLGLQFNNNVYTSPAVTTGFSVALAIANLGFVLGIIIIAIATILRNQTYGIKNLLWKLVMMAILVNFGLVITAPIVGFADSMSNYFINATSPGSMSVAGYEGYAQTMTAAFAPQDLQLGGSQNAVNTNAAANGAALGASTGCGAIPVVGGPGLSWLCSKIASFTANISTSDNFWQMIMAMVFDIAFSAMIVFTFFCLAILLLVRYLMLGGLLIVLPLAWLTYIFPKFDNSFSKWWNAFIKWTFFPPLALFFIYLAFITATNTTAPGTSGNSYEATLTGIPAAPVNPANGTVELSLGIQTGLAGNVIQEAADEVLLVGLTIMGLMFALSLSGKAGSTVVNGATSVSKVVGGYVGKRTGRAATRVYQKAGGDNLNAALQRSRIPLVPAVGRGMANLTESATKNRVDARSKALQLSGMDDDRLKDVTQGLRGKEDQLAALQEWQKRGKADKIEKIGGVNLQEWLSKNQQTFKDYRQGKLSGDIDNAMMSNEEIRRIARTKAAAGATAEVVDENGIVGLVGMTVRASEMKSRASEEARKAQEVVDRSGANTFIPHNGSQVKAGDLVNLAKAAVKEADDAIEKKGNMAMVVDEEGRLGTKGEKQEAGDLMQVASEKFWEGKDKGAAGKMRPDAIFGNKPKFGLDTETLAEIGRSVAHGIVTQSPGAMGSLAGKTDNLQQLTRLTNAYTKGVQNARESNKISEEQAKKMDDAIQKMLGSKLAFMGGGGEEHAPTAPAPAPTAPH